MSNSFKSRPMMPGEQLRYGGEPCPECLFDSMDKFRRDDWNMVDFYICPKCGHSFTRIPMPLYIPPDDLWKEDDKSALAIDRFIRVRYTKFRDLVITFRKIGLLDNKLRKVFYDWIRQEHPIHDEVSRSAFLDTFRSGEGEE